MSCVGWLPRYRGELAGIGRGWRGKVRAEVCAACYGSSECGKCGPFGVVLVEISTGAILCAARPSGKEVSS